MATQNFKIIELPNATLIGLSADFYGAMSPKFNGQEVLGPLWRNVRTLGAALNLPANTGMMSATTPSENDTNAEGLLTQFVGFVVQEVPENLGELKVFQVPGGKYASIEHAGGMDSLVASIQDFYNKFLPEAGCSQRSGLHLEIYDERYNDTDTSVMTIAAPIR